jgi:CRP-like cAMP-binding protein
MSMSPDELHLKYGISREEIADFRDLIRVYSNQDVIISEGEKEQAMYILRVGTVKVFKRSGEAQKFMTMIEPINIFGELSGINNEARTATVIAMSDQVVCYRIADASAHAIAGNPLWAELLISRLAQSLARSIEQHVAAAETVKQLRAEVERLKTGKG